MASKTDSIIVQYSVGTGNNLGKATAKQTSWLKFTRMFETPVRTRERLKAYLAMPNEEQQRLKGAAGWVHRTAFEGKSRNAADGKPSYIFSLDFDYALPEWVENLLAGNICPGFEYIIHTSRRHTEEKPRIRIWGLFDRPVTREEYGPITRIIAQRFFDEDMAMVDKVSFRKAQMMFLPTCSADSQFIYERNRGVPFPVDDIFDHFTETVGDWRDMTLLPKVDGEELREHAEKAEVPTEKVGPVGDFCRAYSITEAMDKWIPGTYEESDHDSEKPRYSYLGGTTANGAVLEDDDTFLYSHHGSDPCADMLVNAFDMVRIHKFGDLDANVEKDTPMGKRPSYEAMIELIKDDPLYKRQQVESKYDMLAMMDDVMGDDYIQDDDYEAPEQEEIDADIADLVGGTPSNESDFDDDIAELVGKPKKAKPAPSRPLAADAPSPNRNKKRQPPRDWFPDELEIDKQGNIIQNLPNAQTIIHNDVRLFDAIAYDDFMCRIVLLRDIQSKMPTVPPLVCHDKVRGDIWQDSMDMTIRAILAGPNGAGKRGYGMDKMAERDLATAIHLTALRNRFHPIKELLTHAADEVGWDGVSRVDTLFVDHLGVENTIYHRQAARMVMVASVARIFEPGCKFDYAPVLQGEQGIRKSSFIETLYGSEFFGELTCNLRNTQQIAETIGGVWGMELPELSAMYKSDHNDAKQFLSAKVDKVRMAYDRRVSVFQRQAVFWGTTNDKKYLKDPTGNRRWWPIIIGLSQIDTDALREVRIQLWAEAVTIYRQMRAEQPHGSLPLFLTDPEAQKTALNLQTEARTELLFEGWADQIDGWADKPVTLRQFMEEHKLLTAADKFDEDEKLDTTMVQRVVFLNNQAGEGALGFDRTITNAAIIQDIDRAVSHLSGWKNEGNRKYRLGVQGRWKIRNDATPQELAVGYRVVDAGESDDLV